MGKLAFLFPGQGNLAPIDTSKLEIQPDVDTLIEADDYMKELFGPAFGLWDLCFKGPAEEMNRSSRAQVITYAMSIAHYRGHIAKGIKPFAVAGHSVGDYAACCAAGSIGFRTGLKLVATRGTLMEDSASAKPGKMMAIQGLPPSDAWKIVEKFMGEGIVELACVNSFNQFILSGENSPEKPLMEKVATYAKEIGAKHVIPLETGGGAFHSLCMAEASTLMRQILADDKQVHFSDADKHWLFLSTLAGVAKDGFFIRMILQDQILAAVQWLELMEMLRNIGEITDVIEMAPGRALTRFWEQTARK